MNCRDCGFQTEDQVEFFSHMTMNCPSLGRRSSLVCEPRRSSFHGLIEAMKQDDSVLVISQDTASPFEPADRIRLTLREKNRTNKGANDFHLEIYGDQLKEAESVGDGLSLLNELLFRLLRVRESFIEKKKKEG